MTLLRQRMLHDMQMQSYREYALALPETGRAGQGNSSLLNALPSMNEATFDMA